MSEQIRYNVARAAVRWILARIGYPQGVEHAVTESTATYGVLEAIYQAEAALAEYACCFMCPWCYRQYRINVALRGREVTCVQCGYQWRAPDVVEPN